MKRTLLTTLLGVSSLASAQYAEHGISASDSSFKEWATGYENLVRGPQNIANPSGAKATYGKPESALGKADGTMGVVSLGDGGEITLTFDHAITNGEGADFAVFENSFASGPAGWVYAELAFVEVSSNGTDFFRFPSVSLTQTTTQVGGFAPTDPTKVHNLAGQFVALEGTPFDLSYLAGVSPLLDVNNITKVKMIDVVGSINPLYARYDSQGHIINDPWSSPFASGGFDLDAVGVIHAVPEPTSFAVLLIGLVPVLKRRQKPAK